MDSSKVCDSTHAGSWYLNNRKDDNYNYLSLLIKLLN